MSLSLENEVWQYVLEITTMNMIQDVSINI